MQPGFLSVMKRVYATATLTALAGVIGCSDSMSGNRTSTTPPAPPPSAVSRLRGTVDVAAGTLTFDAPSTAGPALASGAPNAAIYGNQGVTVRIYNSAVVTSAPVAGKKTYTANVGIRNLLAYRIGDEQGALLPADTMGIYVFVSSGPVVSGTSSSCPACTVTVKNQHGTLNFNATNQPYWFWPELLGPANGGRDTTLTRKTWVFEADTQVTRFNFDVLVSAAWVSPNETIWKVDYPGDSLPDTQAEPKWRKFASGGGAEAITAGNLVLTVLKTKDSIAFIRRDSVRSTTNALMEARLRLDDGRNSAAPQPGVAIDDSVKYVGLFLSDSSGTGRARVGFIDALGTGFIASDTVSAVKSFRVYQLRKYGADSATILVDGTRRVGIAYSSLPATKAVAPLPSYFEFAFIGGTVRMTTSTWDYVVYQIGKATP